MKLERAMDLYTRIPIFRKNKQWSGILCEPASFWIEKLKVNRPNCIIESSPIFSISDEKNKI